MSQSGISQLILGLIAIVLPPLAVALEDGTSGSLVISIVLTCLMWVPGVLHALFVVFR